MSTLNQRLYVNVECAFVCQHLFKFQFKYIFNLKSTYFVNVESTLNQHTRARWVRMRAWIPAETESKRSIPRNFDYYGYSFYIMIKVIKSIVFTIY